MNRHTLFIADVHLQPDPEHPINRAFLHFLEHEAPQADALYILGDLFEMWVGDDIGLEQYAPIIKALAKLTQGGLPIYLQFGNRDFLMRRRFWKATGIQPLPDPAVRDIYGNKVWLTHGDLLCTDDHDYQKMRRILRNPLVTWLFLRLPRSKRLQIGEKMRESSRRHSRNKAENIMDVSQTAVESLLKRKPAVQHLIHGHTHRPAHHLIEGMGAPHHRWVLGDWRPQSRILKMYADGSFVLQDYPA